MAAALMAKRAGDTIQVLSAVTKPDSAANGLSAESLTEVGVDISGEIPKAITDEMVRDTDVVVTLGGGAHVDQVPGIVFETWDTDEPSERGIDGIERMRLVRDGTTTAPWMRAVTPRPIRLISSACRPARCASRASSIWSAASWEWPPTSSDIACHARPRQLAGGSCSWSCSCSWVVVARVGGWVAVVAHGGRS